MLVASHKQIGNVVCNTVEKKLGIKLDIESILRGCELPDKSAEYLLIPHFKKYSFKFILSLINSLEKDYNIDDKENLMKFSLNLGIVIHYISDYFCSAHNHFKFNFFPLHIIYEYVLAHKFNTTSLDNIAKSTDLIPAHEYYKTPFYLKNYINKKVIQYQTLPISPINDIRYSIEVCTAMTYIIIMKCIENSLPIEFTYEELPLEKAQ